MSWLATTLALASAATFAVSTSVQHEAAGSAPVSARGALRLVGYLLRRPSWLVGQVLAVAGFALHALALHFGPIAVVQPIVITGIVFAVPVRAAIGRRLPSAAEVQAVGVTALGLAVFLVASDPSEGSTARLDARPVVLTVVGALLAGAAVLAARTTGSRTRSAFLLGVSAGILFGLVAGLLKLALQELAAGGIVRMLTVWPTWGVLVAGGAGVLTNQLAYRVARLSASMPVLNIVDGLVALGFGYLVFAEVPRHSPPFLALEAAAMAGIALGLLLIGRLAEPHPAQPRRVKVPD